MTIFVRIKTNVNMRTLCLHLLGWLSITVLLCSCGAASSTTDASQDNQVNIGYGTVDKDDLTYSVSSLKLNDQENTYTNMYEYLRGRVPGVVVGNDNSITIRGVNSINSSTEPLILLDGTAIDDLSIVNPQDVYSVDVLKDSSSSIYGLRGANGVILITTKGAQQEKVAAAEALKREKAARKAARKAKSEKNK